MTFAGEDVIADGSALGRRWFGAGASGPSRPDHRRRGDARADRVRPLRPGARRRGPARGAGLHPGLEPAAVRRGARARAPAPTATCMKPWDTAALMEKVYAAAAGTSAQPAASPRPRVHRGVTPRLGDGGRGLRRDQHRLVAARATPLPITHRRPGLRPPRRAPPVGASGGPARGARHAPVAHPRHAPRRDAARRVPARCRFARSVARPHRRPGLDAAASRGTARRPHDDRPAGRRRADPGRASAPRRRWRPVPCGSPTAPVAPLAPMAPPPTAPVMSFVPAGRRPRGRAR